ncbi:MAG: valine--tRNA ligase [Nitrosomonas sp.]|nr:MAG: valine--tRNA ligase [Nitrosomonas sp.]
MTETALPKAYEAKDIEKKWYAFWQQLRLFSADPHSEKEPFSIVMPPPNVTGVLHMGHALVSTLQDVIIRWQRMLGKEVLWVPGTDHAGIATQTVVERHLMKTEGKRRQDYRREEFLKRVWDWKEQSQQRIIGQLKALGCSCDWERERFTMDPGANRAVRAMFKKLYEANLIYRGDYLVNWDPVTQTALADDEVEYEERDSFLWYFKYPLADGSGYVTVATTRPETMLGDTAVAVAPSDERYAHMVGKAVRQPLTNRDLPIIADHHVDPQFGTGVVKITPAHDPNDYQMGFRHQLSFINIMTPDGRINDNGGRFAGLTMEEAREAVVAAMKELGLLEKAEPHVNRVGRSYRSKAIIEPFLSKQWFVRMNTFATKLRSAVENQDVKLIPKHWDKVYFHWIDNLRDWCISRQLWWGHRIPIWYRVDNPDETLCYDGEGVPPEVAENPNDWVQDNDVLDTWFSSGLWPFSTLGWPEKTPEMKKFYPNSLLITGHDILFFWVARMILMGEYAEGQAPFPEVFLHGLIYGKSYWRDNPDGGITYIGDTERQEYDLGKPIPKDVKSKWEKMSKSKGNIIDPLEVIEQYGTDAMRMALCSSATQARQIDLDRRRFEEFKNFANKVWNGARFVLMNLDGDEKAGTSALTADAFSKGLNPTLLSLEDRWILSVLNRTIRDVNEKLAAYAFDQAAMEAYEFFWKEFCAFYVEIAKPVLFGKRGSPEERENKQKLLVIVLCQAVRLLHPMTPFITEELFQRLKSRLEGVQLHPDVDSYTAEAIKALTRSSCMVAAYPQVICEADINPDINAAFDLVERAVYTIRNIRGEMQLPPSTSTEIHLIGQPGDSAIKALEQNSGIIQALVRTHQVTVHTGEEPQIGFASTGVLDNVKIMIPLPPELIEKERQRLTKEQERLKISIEKLSRQLDNADFVQKAPAELLQKQRDLLQQNTRELEEVSTKLGSFKEAS